ncbi:DMT family transporter [Sutterella sp.]|uniref:DMT family transporter n=1 Tax=Sutterella sp. TaxID=1981025 RepID=UPI0026E0B59F|nr:DMT family transporter [Sutterella sp.]MDO5532691.1 DMT family transporter [Sutterella sp.]
MMKQSLWSLAAALLFSLMAAFVKLSSGELGSLEMVFYRSLFGMIVIALYVQRNHLTLKTPYVLGNLNRSVLGTLSIGAWFYTLGELPFGTNMTLIYTTPLFMAVNFIILAWMKHQRAPWALVLSIIVGFVGIAIVLQPSFSRDELVPALICLAVSFLDLIIYWQMKQLGDLKEPSWRIVFYFTCCGTVFGLVGTYLLEEGLHMPTVNSLIAILGMGACATLGQICTTRSYAYGNMLLSSCLGFSAIPFSALISWLLFGEAQSVVTLAGMSLILGAGLAATISTKRSEAAAAG